MYQVHPDDELNMFWVYCDMTSFGGGMDQVNPRTEVTYNEKLPYGIDGYRTDCNNVEVNSLSLRSNTTSQREFRLGIPFIYSEIVTVKFKSLHTSHVAHQARAYLRFL